MLSDVRASISGSTGSLSSALSRRNATRLTRRNDAQRWEQSRNRTRRFQNPMRAIPNPGLSTPPMPRSPEEPSSKRRRTERSGQVEMEQLHMELRFCDGGRHEGHSHAFDYSPECALRDDSSVYCTKNMRCNMILRHVDGDCFSIQKLVIRAPPRGYTSPVCAGMIFITMDETDLLYRTNYTVHYEMDDCDDSSDDESYDLRFLESDSGDPNDTDSAIRPFPPILRNPRNPNTVPRGGGGAPSSSPLWTNVEDQINQSRPPPAELLQPHATFSHKDRTPNYVINFEPAISGRYILAKFFATPAQKNIDIEFIGAYGWVGRRFFPAITMR
ncbi:hypothetical protein BDD12DRAFT_838842 [Trichophaea hybrida]|nr:hypothetical protein BDD12DRAFT_838842 [Trichophaea hybrida]